MSTITLVNFQVEEHTVFPIALSHVGERLQDGGHEVKLLDLQVRKFEEKYQAEYVGFSVPAFTIEFVESSIAYLHRYFPKAQIIIGGNDICKETAGSILQWFSKVAVVIGDIYPAFDDIVKGGPGIYRSAAPNLDKPLRYSLADPIDLRRVHRVSLLCSTGCVHRCKFCAAHPFRLRPKESVLQEIDLLAPILRRIDFSDSCFFDVPYWRAIAEHCQKKSVRFGLITDLRKEKRAEQIRSAMDLGMYYCIYGIETFKQRSLTAVRKEMSVRIARKVLKEVQRFNPEDGRFFQSAFLLAGLPFQLVGDVMQDVETCKELGIKYPMMSVLVCQPHYEKAYDRNMMDVAKFATNGNLRYTPWLSHPEVRRIRKLAEELCERELQYEVGKWYI